MRKIVWGVLFFTLASCGQNKKNPQDRQVTQQDEPVAVQPTDECFEKAYFASGCFWCSESIYKSVFGVNRVVSGYSGGTGENPRYEDYVKKGHAETVEVVYNPKVVDYATLLEVYFASQDVTQQNGQGPDLGPGYRSVIFYQNQAQKEAIEKKIAQVQKTYAQPVAAQVIPFKKFWKAEEYHQNFEEKHPNHPYIRNVSLPRLYKFQNRNPDLLKPSRS